MHKNGLCTQLPLDKSVRPCLPCLAAFITNYTRQYPVISLALPSELVKITSYYDPGRHGLTNTSTPRYIHVNFKYNNYCISNIYPVISNSRTLVNGFG